VVILLCSIGGELMGQQDFFYSLFSLSEFGFKLISILFMVTILVGLIAAILFRRNLNGKKIMLIGGELILLGLIFNIIIDFKVRYPSLSFITILIGTIVSFIGLCKKD
jgi:hypothetical protein